ncbi:hypothetical protein [Arthrobacter sp. lap29]|uniref:hypothetical protein n=1 Tax=Arthrobacter sp. lap29 TaxID=3056122 RepID=UPI0028F70263|nr:hypothetical protein [Arthrobacter sp. lap29]
MVSNIELERKYSVEGSPELMPYSVAKKFTRYPEWCVSDWHLDVKVPVPAARDSNLCPECVDLLRDSWATMAGAWPLLQDMVHPSQQFGNSERVGGGSVHPPLPINVSVSDLLRDIRDSVGSVVNGLIEDCPDWKMPAAATTDVLADHLSKWKAEYVADHPRPGHAWSVLREAWLLAQRVGKAGASDHTAAEVDTESHCRKQWMEWPKGKPLLHACEGMVMAVQPAGGGKAVARCDADPEHAIPFDVWLMVRGTKAKQSDRTKAHLIKKFT